MWHIAQAVVLVTPGHAKAHMQLAVLALQCESTHDAALHYMRALSTAHPIPTAREALCHIFDKA